MSYAIEVAGAGSGKASVPCSKTEPSSTDSGQLSIVALTVTATNKSEKTVEVSEIGLLIDGDSWGAPTNLTADPSTIVAEPGGVTPWALCGALGKWSAFPLPPAVQVLPGEAISLVFSGIVVNLMPGVVKIPVTETRPDGVKGEETLEVTKTEATGPYVSKPVIRTFAVTPAQATRGQSVTVRWEVENMEGEGTCQLLVKEQGVEPPPAPVTLTPPGKGSMQVPVNATTVFELRAINTGGTATQVATVAVMPVSIASFTASPATVAPGQPVTLAWQASYATNCSIDNGVGPVDLEGPKTVKPEKTTVYTLNATNGKQQVQRSVTVTVT